MLEFIKNYLVNFDYVNWKGVKAHRKVVVLGVYYGSTEYHQEKQWLLKAIDMDKREERIFAMKDITNFKIGS